MNSSDRRCDTKYSYDEAVEMTGHGRYNYLMLTACCVISNAVAIDTFGFSVIVAAATCDLQLGITETGVLASVPFAGTVFGFAWGYYADVSGRRRVLLLCTCVSFTMSALSSLAPNWQAMLALKLVGCCFSANAYTLTMTYMGESTGALRRSRYLSLINCANLAAEVIFYGLAYLLLPLSFNLPISWLSISYRPWRLYTLVLAIPLGVGAVMLLVLYESPKFLASRGDSTKALSVLQCMYEVNGGKKEDYPVKVLSTQDGEEPKKKSFWSTVVAQTVPLFRPPLLQRTLQLCYLFIVCCSINNIYLMWYPMMVNLFFNSYSPGSNQISDVSFCDRIVANITTGANTDDTVCDDRISTNTIYAGIILGLVFVTLNLSAAIVASWRRLVLISTFLVSVICLILVEHIRNPVANLIVFTLVQITAVGIGSVASYYVDIYPTFCRGLALSLGMMSARLVAFGGVNAVGAVIVNHCSATFYFSAVFVFGGAVTVLFLP